MLAIAGATGRVGSIAAKKLLAEGEAVRVLVRSESAASAWSSRGADVRTCSLEDTEVLAEALTGCSGFFVLLPFDLEVGDLDAYADALISSISESVIRAGVPHIAALSSGGADLAEGTGPITGLHRLEQALLSTGAKLSILRPAHFQEKVADLIDVAEQTGIFPVFSATADKPLPMVATMDIGAAVARSLIDPPTNSEVIDILGPAHSEREVASLLSDKLGRDLEVAALPEEAWLPALADAGFRTHIARSLAELYRADEAGLLAPRGDRVITGTTRLEITIDHLPASGRGNVSEQGEDHVEVPD